MISEPPRTGPLPSRPYLLCASGGAQRDACERVCLPREIPEIIGQPA